MNTVLLNIKPDISKDIRWAFAYFFIAVLLGIFMRSVGVVTYPFEFNYRFAFSSVGLCVRIVIEPFAILFCQV